MPPIYIIVYVALFQPQICVVSNIKSYLCINNLVYDLDGQLLLYFPIIFIVLKKTLLLYKHYIKFTRCSIDFHKIYVVICIVSTDSNVITTMSTNYAKNLKDLLRYLTDHNYEDVCIESTDKYWILIYDVLKSIIHFSSRNMLGLYAERNLTERFLMGCESD